MKGIDWQKEYRDEAITHVKALAEVMVKRHPQPVRRGKKKGEIIGFTKKKQLAAYLSILHVPNRRSIGVSLKEIARMSGTPQGVLRVWKLEPKFVKEMYKACVQMGDMIMIDTEDKMKQWGTDMNTGQPINFIPLDGSLQELLFYVLPFLNPKVKEHVTDLINEILKSERRSEAWKQVSKYLAFVGRQEKEFLVVKISERGVGRTEIRHGPGQKSMDTAINLYANAYPDLMRLHHELKGLNPANESRAQEVQAAKERILRELKKEGLRRWEK